MIESKLIRSADVAILLLAQSLLNAGYTRNRGLIRERRFIAVACRRALERPEQSDENLLWRGQRAG